MAGQIYKKAPVNVDEIYVNPDSVKKARIRLFVEQAKNPYLVEIDGVCVEMEYAEDGPTLQEAVGVLTGIDG